MARSFFPLLALILSLGVAAPSSALLLDFYENLAHGEIAVGEPNETDDFGFADFGLYSVRVTNANRGFHLGVAFDTNQNGTTDPDIEFGSGWSSGNLDEVGNILILQENLTGCGDGVCDDPDDEGGYPLAGIWRFDFTDHYTRFEISLLDLGDHPDEQGSILFLDGGSVVSSFGIDELAGLFPLQNLVFGQDSANHVVFDADTIGGAFDAIEVYIWGSGGIDGLVVDGITQVPEPGTMGLVGLGLVGLALRTRRRIA